MSDTGHSAAQATGAAQGTFASRAEESRFLRLRIERLERQRDELLAALREVMAHVQFFNPDEPNYTAGDENECTPWKQARAAIAKATGDQP